MSEVKEKVWADEFVWQVKSMVETCFEGEIEPVESGLLLTLPNGQKFLLGIQQVG